MALGLGEEEEMEDITFQGSNLEILGKILVQGSLPARTEKDCPIEMI